MTNGEGDTVVLRTVVRLLDVSDDEAAEDEGHDGTSAAVGLLVPYLMSIVFATAGQLTAATLSVNVLPFSVQLVTLYTPRDPHALH